MKISKAALTLTVVGLVGLAMAYPDADLVTSLEQMDDISFGLYSGLFRVIIVGTQKKLHYVATLSRGNKLTDLNNLDILVQQYYCSSMLGFSQENGPYALNDADTIFRKNDYAWNQQANVIYLESPAGVGYSQYFNIPKNANSMMITLETIIEIQIYCKLLVFYKNSYQFRYQET